MIWTMGKALDITCCFQEHVASYNWRLDQVDSPVDGEQRAAILAAVIRMQAILVNMETFRRGHAYCLRPMLPEVEQLWARLDKTFIPPKRSPDP
jgi:hypothetical protein